MPDHPPGGAGRAAATTRSAGPGHTPPPPPPEPVDPTLSAVHAAALAFERAWQAGPPADLAPFLPPPGPARGPALLELVLIDLERRRLAGLPADPAAYLAAFPELASDPGGAARVRAAARPPAAPAPPGYALGEVLGSGGMGDVYRGHDARLGRPVAVKVLQPRYPAGSAAALRFVEEARITAQLQHPGIPPVHEVGELPDGRPFLAMKLIKGRTLAEIIAAGTADRGRLVGAFEQVCQAVGYAHSKGVVHRDLKPGNVMIGAFGEVQVMDWGLAKFRADARPEAARGAAVSGFEDPREGSGSDLRTRAGSFLGTPAFMAPEQAAGAVEVIDERTDVFGLGGILCAILTGEPPFVAGTGETARLLAARGELGPAFARLAAAGAEPELVALCKRCLAADPGGRPADAGAVAAAVAGLRADADRRAREAELDRVRDTERRRRRRAVTTTVLGLVVAAAAVAVGLVRESDRAVRAVQVAGLVDGLLAAAPSELTAAAKALEPYRGEAAGRVRAVMTDPGAGPRARTNAAVFLADDPAAVDFLLARLPEVRPPDLPPLVAALAPAARRDPGRFWAAVRADAAESGTRARCAAVLAAADPGNPVWAAAGGDLAALLAADAAPADAGAWAGLFAPVRDHLRDPLVRAMTADPDGDRGYAATGLLAALFRGDPALAAFLDRASPRQAGVLVPALADAPRDAFPADRLAAAAARDHGWDPAMFRVPVVDGVGVDPEVITDAAAATRAAAALALIAAGRGERVWHLFAEGPDPRVRTYLIHRAAATGVDPAALLAQLAAPHPPSTRQALLLALGGYHPDRLAPGLLAAAAARVAALYRSDPDPGVHSACRWVLRQWGRGGPVAALDRVLATPGPAAGRDWFTTPAGTTFAVARGPVEVVAGSPPREWHRDWSHLRTEDLTRWLVPRDFAVATTEVTVGELDRMVDDVSRRWPGEPAVAALAGAAALPDWARFRHFLKEDRGGPSRYYPTPDHPVGHVRHRVAMAYCRWLGEVEGVPDEEQPYPPIPEILLAAARPRPRPGFLDRTGYRLPTEAEWEAAARAGTRTRYPHGADDRLLGRYAWYQGNVTEQAAPGGRLMPNGQGLFDVLGNQFERCHGWPYPTPGRPAGPSAVDDGLGWDGLSLVPMTLRGGGFSRMHIDHRVAFRRAIHQFGHPDEVHGDSGFRIARTVRPAAGARPAELGEVYEVPLGGTGTFAVKETVGPFTVRPLSGTLPATLRVVAPVPPGWTRPAVTFTAECSDRPGRVTVTRARGGRELRVTAGPDPVAAAIRPAGMEFRPRPDADPVPVAFTDPGRLPPYVLVPAATAAGTGWWAYPAAAARPAGPTAFGWDTATTWAVRYLDWKPAAAGPEPPPPAAAEWAAALARPPLAAATRPDPGVTGPADRPPDLRPGPAGIVVEGELDLPAGVYEFTAATDRGHRLLAGGRVVADAWLMAHAMVSRVEVAWPGGRCRVRLETFTRGEAPEARVDVRPLRFGPAP